MRNIENQWNSLKIHGISMEIHGKSTKLIGNQWKIKEIHRNAWKSLEIYGTSREHHAHVCMLRGPCAEASPRYLLLMIWCMDSGLDVWRLLVMDCEFL